MNTYKFMVQTPYTEERIRETWWKSRPKYIVASYVLAAVGTLCFLVYLIRASCILSPVPFEESHIVLIVCWVLFPVYCAFLLMYPKFLIRRDYRQATCGMDTSNLATTTEFYEDRFIFFSATEVSTTEVSYGMLKNIKETENYFIVFTLNGKAFAFSKTVTAGGSDVEFAQFLHSLCPKS